MISTRKNKHRLSIAIDASKRQRQHFLAASSVVDINVPADALFARNDYV